MEKSFEKIYSAAEKEGEKKEVAIEISKEEWQILEIIAKRVGGDFGMEVRLGKAGGGSFFDPRDSSITFDPLHIRDNIEQAKFIAGHEGSHRAITPGPEEIGLLSEEIKKFYSQIGFGYLQNVIEDAAVNDWMRKRFPGLEPYITKTYDEQFKEENAVLSTPEVQRIAAQLGYWPKFSQYGSEVLRDWHQQRFSKKLDPGVEKALKRTIDLARESISMIPDPQKPSQDKKEIIAQAQKRFENNTNYIWPEVKKLVEIDLHTEEQRQMLNDRDLFNQLPEDTRKELEQQIDKANKEAAENMNKEIEEKQNQFERAKQKQEEIEKEIKDLEEKAKSASGKEKEELERQIKERQAEKLAQEIKQKQLEQDLKNIQDTLEDMQSGKLRMPYPEDKLSPETKKEIEKFFKNLPKEKQNELRQKAEKQLEDFEDAINQEMEGKLNIDKPKSHQEMREERKKQEKELEEKTRKAEEGKKAEEEKKRLEKKLEEMRREKMTDYDKAYEEVADIVNSLYNRLKKIFLPERHPKWRKGYPSGSRLDLEKAMQAEADPRYLEKLWERKTIPHKFDYRFSLLVDTSGSMGGEKIEETFKGVVVLAEVLEKLGIQYEITAFSDSSRIFKQWREKLNKEKRDHLSQIKSFGGGGTETTAATQKSYLECSKNLGKNNFLLTLTDGQPNNSESLKQLLEKIKKEGKIKLVGIGLGPDTEFVKDFYKAAFSLAKMKVTEEERRQGKKDFTEAFADLLEDMIRHPEKY